MTSTSSNKFFSKIKNPFTTDWSQYTGQGIFPLTVQVDIQGKDLVVNALNEDCKPAINGNGSQKKLSDVIAEKRKTHTSVRESSNSSSDNNLVGMAVSNNGDGKPLSEVTSSNESETEPSTNRLPSKGNNQSDNPTSVNNNEVNFNEVSKNFVSDAVSTGLKSATSKIMKNGGSRKSRKNRKSRRKSNKKRRATRRQ